MPKKAVLTFFLLALAGAIAFTYFTFPRTRSEIPGSNNQRPFPSFPSPGDTPVPDTVPRPNTPVPQHGPSLRVMAWAGSDEAKVLGQQAEAFRNATGCRAALMIVSEADYRKELQDALTSDTPPDVFLIGARDFTGLDPQRDLAPVRPTGEVMQRGVAAFTIDGEIRAVPDEFSVDVLFYNRSYFDQAGLGYPDRHWNWDILEAISRALASLKLHDATGQPVYPLEVGADFDLWNILCTQAGRPVLDLDAWHLTEDGTKDSQMRALDFIRNFFHTLSVTAPLPKPKEATGHLFAQQRAVLLIAPSDLVATLPQFNYAFTLLPSDMARASLARVNGWAVSTRSTHSEQARQLANFLASKPLHAGWSSFVKPTADGPDALCYEAMEKALLPRIETKTAPMAQFLDQQIGQLARNAGLKTVDVYAAIQAECQRGFTPPPIGSSLPQAAAKVSTP